MDAILELEVRLNSLSFKLSFTFLVIKHLNVINKCTSKEPRSILLPGGLFPSNAKARGRGDEKIHSGTLHETLLWMEFIIPEKNN